MSFRTRTASCWMFSLANLFYTAGSFIADFNETHVLNPRWPPHARFHNGQTMSLGLMLASCSMYLALKPAATAAEKSMYVWLAAIVSSMYCTAGISAILYPGTAWADPEFEVSVQGGQGYGFALQVVIVWVAYALEMRSIATKSKKL